MFIIDNFPEQILVKAIIRTASAVKNRQSTTNRNVCGSYLGLILFDHIY